MSDGKRITANELFARTAERNKAAAAKHDEWLKTPDGHAWITEQRRLDEADKRFALDNPNTPYQAGADAALAGEERKPPDDLSVEDADDWLNGYDDQGEPPDDDA